MMSPNARYGSIANDLTVEDVRACREFAHLSDEQAGEVIETLRALTKIAFDWHKKVAENDGS